MSGQIRQQAAGKNPSYSNVQSRRQSGGSTENRSRQRRREQSDVIPAIRSEYGQKHPRLWLTKRPERMILFAHGISRLLQELEDLL